MHRLFGLIGYPLGHSFSPGYFAEKFSREGVTDALYELFPLESIAEFKALVRSTPALCGLNVTIPYKEAVIPFLDRLHPAAETIGAVNTIHFSKGRLVGYNTDVVGFERSLVEWIGQDLPERALVLGSGGSSKAVRYGLDRLGIAWTLVSRHPAEQVLTYKQLNEKAIASHPLIINTTPLGMHPIVDQRPEIPYAALGPQHLLYDLIYNPEKTLFLKAGVDRGARIRNGLRMLELQAEAAWEIWNSDPA